MRVPVKCPSCHALYQVAEQKLGSATPCRRCGTTFTLEMSAGETIFPAGNAKPAEAAPKPPPLWKSAPRAITPAASPSPPPLRAVTAPPPLPPAATPEAKGPTPKAVGRYVLKKELGSGAMGTVWLAHDPDLDRDLAIKILPAEYSKDQTRLKRFRREAQLAAKLHHANAVTVHDVGAASGEAFIAMEYVEGDSLQKIVERRGRMLWRDATRAVRDAAAGLAAAHSRGLIHRDVKPPNLMQTREGVTKVVDFGLARAMAGGTQLTHQTQLLGTPAYMSPEQWMGRTADARSDLYSLICSYYFLLTGRVPFEAPELPALGYQHRYEPFPDARQIVPDLPEEVCRIIERGAKKEPSARYQTAEELLAALDAALGETVVRTTRLPPPLLSRVKNSAASVMRSVPPAVTATVAAAIRTPLRKTILAAGAAGFAILLAVVLYVSTNYGRVKIELEPAVSDVQVKIDGNTIDVTGLKDSLRIRAGEHNLLVEAGQYKTYTTSFSVHRGSADVLKVTLEPIPKPPPKQPPPAPVAPAAKPQAEPKPDEKPREPPLDKAPPDEKPPPDEPPAGVKPPEPPDLISPANGATLPNPDPPTGFTVSWQPVPNAGQYWLQIYAPGQTEPIVDMRELHETSVHVNLHKVVSKASCHGWRWRVNAGVGGKWTGWSYSRSFNMAEPAEPAETPKQIVRQPLPSGDAFLQASKTVRDLYADQYAGAKTAEQRQVLAKAMLKRAEESADPAMQYALMDRARVILAYCGDLRSALAIVDQMAASFEADLLELKRDTLIEAFSAETFTMPTDQNVVNWTLDVMRQLKRVERYDDAVDLGKRCAAWANRHSGQEIVRQVNTEVGVINAAKQEKKNQKGS